MTAFPGPETERPRGPEDIASMPAGLAAFAHIEGLCGEEARLLAIPHEERTREHHDRLRAIGDELDRIWEHLRERAERLGRPRPGAQTS
jgi:hypothetical protein